MKLLLLILCFTGNLGANACDEDPLNSIKHEEILVPQLIICANNLISLGEKPACAKLAAIRVECSVKGMQIRERICWISRLLFKGKVFYLRPPAFGELPFPDIKPEKEDWPLFPIAQSGDSFFILARGYDLIGRAENVADYLQYCSHNGVFRTEPLPVPSLLKMRQDLTALRVSPKWARLQWSKTWNTGSYFFDEKDCWEVITKQVPNK